MGADLDLDLDRARDERRATQLWIAISAVTWIGLGVYVWRSDAVPVGILGVGIVQLLVGILDLAARQTRPLAGVTAPPRAVARRPWEGRDRHPASARRAPARPRPRSPVATPQVVDDRG